MHTHTHNTVHNTHTHTPHCYRDKDMAQPSVCVCVCVSVLVGIYLPCGLLFTVCRDIWAGRSLSCFIVGPSAALEYQTIKTRPPLSSCRAHTHTHTHAHTRTVAHSQKFMHYFYFVSSNKRLQPVPVSFSRESSILVLLFPHGYC